MAVAEPTEVSRRRELWPGQTFGCRECREIACERLNRYEKATGTNTTSGPAEAFPVPDLLRGPGPSPHRPLPGIFLRFQDRSTSEGGDVVVVRRDCATCSMMDRQRQVGYRGRFLAG